MSAGGAAYGCTACRHTLEAVAAFGRLNSCQKPHGMSWQQTHTTRSCRRLRALLANESESGKPRPGHPHCLRARGAGGDAPTMDAAASQAHSSMVGAPFTGTLGTGRRAIPPCVSFASKVRRRLQKLGPRNVKSSMITASVFQIAEVVLLVCNSKMRIRITMAKYVLAADLSRTSPIYRPWNQWPENSHCSFFLSRNHVGLLIQCENKTREYIGYLINIFERDNL